MEDIIKEKISADHLLYVSLKYTKTCDVIINLLSRWKNMIDRGMDRLVEKARKDKKWKPTTDAPLAKLIQLKKIYVEDEEITGALKHFELFRDIEKLDKVRENEFRKGVNLRVSYRGDEVNIEFDIIGKYLFAYKWFESIIR